MKRRPVHRNPIAKALEQGQYHPQRKASKKLYKRRPRTPSGADVFLPI